MLDPTGNERGEINERGRGDPQLLRGEKAKMCSTLSIHSHIGSVHNGLVKKWSILCHHLI